jgi:hypothetical protein
VYSSLPDKGMARAWPRPACTGVAPAGVRCPLRQRPLDVRARVVLGLLPVHGDRRGDLLGASADVGGGPSIEDRVGHGRCGASRVKRAVRRVRVP